MSENVSLQVEPKQQATLGAVQQATSGAVQQATSGAVGNAQSATVSVPLVLLQNIKSILDICGDRATFKTSEMYGVGLTYNDLIGYLNAKTNKSTVKSV